MNAEPDAYARRIAELTERTRRILREGTEPVVLWWESGQDADSHGSFGGVPVDASFCIVYRLVGREPSEALQSYENRRMTSIGGGPVYAYPLSMLPSIIGCGPGGSLKLAGPGDQVWVVQPGGGRASRVEVSQAEIAIGKPR